MVATMRAVDGLMLGTSMIFLLLLIAPSFKRPLLQRFA